MDTGKQFLFAFILFIIFDLIWLGFIMRDFNMRQLAELGRIEDGKMSILYTPALLVYLLMAAAVVFFVLPRLGLEASVLEAFLWGGAMGLIVFGVYDLTNLAVLKNYPVPLVLADIGWGIAVFGVVTTILTKVKVG